MNLSVVLHVIRILYSLLLPLTYVWEKNSLTLEALRTIDEFRVLKFQICIFYFPCGFLE